MRTSFAGIQSKINDDFMKTLDQTNNMTLVIYKHFGFVVNLCSVSADLEVVC